MKPLYNRQSLTTHILYHGLKSSYWRMCPDGDVWRFGCRTIPIFVYDMLFLLRLEGALAGAYRRWTWAESVI